MLAEESEWAEEGSRRCFKDNVTQLIKQTVLLQLVKRLILGNQKIESSTEATFVDRENVEKLISKFGLQISLFLLDKYFPKRLFRAFNCRLKLVYVKVFLANFSIARPRSFPTKRYLKSLFTFFSLQK